MSDPLPEGTDHVIPGAAGGSTREQIKAQAADLRQQASARAADIKAQASDKAHDYAVEGKERAAAGLESVAKMIGDSAAQIDEKLGPAYGDYARKAAEAVGDFSETLREKQVEELLDDARDLVRRSPAIAIGAAAAAGFMVARIIKAGSEVLEETARKAEPEKADAVSEAVRKAPAGDEPTTES